MHRILPTLILSLSIALFVNAQEPEGPLADAAEIFAKEFVSMLAKGEFLSATKTFDATMEKALSSDQLQQLWTTLISQVGQYQRQIATRKQIIPLYEIVLVTCEFERATLDVKVVLDTAGKVAGLFFLPAQPSEQYTPPEYARPDSFTEEEVSVGTGKWSLPGTLTLPRSQGPHPAVILVHGSGPHDRNETIGPNKPFCDLAWGLASKGIAVLRYEKRTKQHASLLVELKDEITVEEETIEDALAAVTLLQNRPEIDKARIFVLGHSLGGMLMPRIGLRNKHIAGLIILAGTSRPLEDVIYEQYHYIFSLDNQLDEVEQEQLKQLKVQVQLIKSTELTKDTPSAMVFGAPASYWLALRDYDPVAEAAKLTIPILILQGERDYQVTLVDFNRWRDALAANDNVQLKPYPTLNHLFIPGEGRIVPSEYEKMGHIHETVISDITDWIQKGQIE